MADNETRGSGVAATIEPKDDRPPERYFPKKSMPETQNITQIAEEFKVGTRHLRDAAKLAKEQAVTQMQQAETQRMWSQQLSVVTRHCWCNLSSGNKSDD